MSEARTHIDLMIGGFQKCGTTSLKAWLAQHPSIHTHPQVECSFFLDEEQFRGGREFFEKKYFSGLGPKEGERVIAKHAVLFRNIKALERLKKEHPNVQLLFLLRDPVERAFSSYLHQRKMDQESFSFREVIENALTDEPENLEKEWSWRYNVYFGFGCYAYYLQRVQELFPMERIHLYRLEDLQKDPLQILQRIYRDLGIDPGFTPNTRKAENQASEARSRTVARWIRKYVHRENRMKKLLKQLFPSHLLAKGAYKVKEMNQRPVEKESLGSEERERLCSFYKPWNKELESMSGLKFPERN